MRATNPPDIQHEHWLSITVLAGARTAENQKADDDDERDDGGHRDSRERVAAKANTRTHLALRTVLLSVRLNVAQCSTVKR